jgi:hypothetical protein
MVQSSPLPGMDGMIHYSAIVGVSWGHKQSFWMKQTVSARHRPNCSFARLAGLLRLEGPSLRPLYASSAPFLAWLTSSEGGG